MLGPDRDGGCRNVTNPPTPELPTAIRVACLCLALPCCWCCLWWPLPCRWCLCCGLARAVGRLPSPSHAVSAPALMKPTRRRVHKAMRELPIDSSFIGHLLGC